MSSLVHINQLTKTDRKSQYIYILEAVSKTGMLDGTSHPAKIGVRRVHVITSMEGGTAHNLQLIALPGKLAAKYPLW